MPNYKCIKDFKSIHGKVWKAGEMVGEKWYECLEPKEKENFQYLNDFADMPPRQPGLMTVPVDEGGSGEPFFIGMGKEKARQLEEEAAKERKIQEQVEAIQKRNQEK